MILRDISNNSAQLEVLPTSPPKTTIQRSTIKKIKKLLVSKSISLTLIDIDAEEEARIKDKLD